MAAKKRARATKRRVVARKRGAEAAPAADALSRRAVVARITQALGKKYGGRVLTVGDDRRALAEIAEFIPTGLDVLDHYVLGRGGYPVGRMSEIFGEEMSGKTALALHGLAQVQRMGGVAVLADAECSFDSERAATFGVNVDDLILLQPENLEEFFEMAKGVLRMHKPAHGPMLFAWDSIAVTRAKGMLVAEAGDRGMGEVARLMSDELPKILQLLPQHRAHFLMLNQTRHKLGVVFGSNITTPGGNAPKFYASTRLQFFGGKAVKKNDQHIAKVVTILAVKNRLRAPFAKARVRFDYDSGYNNLYSTVEHAKTMGLIKPREGRDGRVGRALYEEAVRKLGWPVGASEPAFEIDEV